MVTRPGLKFLLAILSLTLAILSCNLPTRAAQNLASTAAAGGPQAPEAPAQEISDLSQAAVALEDLPPGFEQLSEEEMEQLGFGREQIAGNFSSMLSRAQPQDYTAFTKVDPPGFQVVLSTVLAPVTTLEKVAVDVYLSNPDQVADDFASGVGVDQVEILPDSANIGSKSIGLSYLNQASPSPMRTDTVLARLEGTLQVAIVIYPEDSEPDITAREVARIVADKTRLALD